MGDGRERGAARGCGGEVFVLIVSEGWKGKEPIADRRIVSNRQSSDPIRRIYRIKLVASLVPVR